ncbi:hypothetical protein CORC01_10377 [Colletotrichum orchidophilum]|uniref:Uncharacterized protein n=1 Tax=Colletotrichum orchidophilum TaxID=1209926 RepID=A0A1G4AYT6_9PEZI|nr:uncharacterized protein CORC01_10377 [Colletotrichum orchidophilum]OHE94330.1 hypothetical protein CORC01_10377 [Colletotrichum orchidophilum]
MEEYEMETFPLESVTRSQLQRLGQALWDWKLCVDNENKNSRPEMTKFEPYFQYYREMTASYVSDAFPPDEVQALRSHDDLHEIIMLIKSKPEVRRTELTEEYFSCRQGGNFTIPEDEKQAFNLAIKAILMISCSYERQTGNIESSIWKNDQSARDFVSATFSARGHPDLNEPDESLPSIKSSLRATRLKKVAGLSLQGTDNLRNHLRMDRKTGVVELFHHTAFLKECLKASKDTKEEPILPRQLALETLDSLQNILFDLDKESRTLLRSLVSKASFDPDCLSLGYQPYLRESEKDIKYHYWGSRLMDLYDELENPRPRRPIYVWLERRSQARHVMLATLIGVFIAIIIGILGLVVGIFQAWVSYQAWKHPVQA